MTGQAGTYILRLYRRTANPDQVRFELELLHRLARADLSFAVPAPLPTGTGELCARVSGPDGEQLAMLMPLIAGVNPDRLNPASAVLAGAALGELAGALAGVSLPPGPNLPHGELGRINPLVPDPVAAASAAPVPPADRDQLVRMVADVAGHVPQLYAGLPRQIIHGDLAWSNLLVYDGRVTGVLDFELATHDLRVMDLVIALTSWPGGLWGTGQEWDQLEGISRGYLSRQSLLPEEIEALPGLLRLRRVVHFLFWYGRGLEGTGKPEHVTYGVETALAVEAWTAANGAELVRRIRQWS